MSNISGAWIDLAKVVRHSIRIATEVKFDPVFEVFCQWCGTWNRDHTPTCAQCGGPVTDVLQKKPTGILLLEGIDEETWERAIDERYNMK